jgi:Hsp20/alpha crystallin family
VRAHFRKFENFFYLTLLARSFYSTCRYVLPKEYDMNTVHSNLSSDGVLTILAKPPMEATGERHVPITHTNIPAHLSVKDNKKHDEQAAK